MFDFISYARDMGIEIKILPPGAGNLIGLELRDPVSGFYERHDITNHEASSCTNIDIYTGLILDQMAARIGSRKAQHFANRHSSHKRQEIEDFFRGK